MATDDSATGSADAVPTSRTYSQHDELLRDRSDRFQDGFEALQAHPEVTPKLVTVTDDDDPGGGNFVFISLGIVNVGRFANYNHDRAEVFIRVPDTFPAGQKYGFATDPVLCIDGQLPTNTQTDRDHAEPLCRALDVDQVLYWSRRWDYMDIDEQGSPDQMQAAVPWMKQVLRTPVKGQ